MCLPRSPSPVQCGWANSLPFLFSRQEELCLNWVLHTDWLVDLTSLSFLSKSLGQAMLRNICFSTLPIFVISANTSKPRTQGHNQAIYLPRNLFCCWFSLLVLRIESRTLSVQNSLSHGDIPSNPSSSLRRRKVKNNNASLKVWFRDRVFALGLLSSPANINMLK